MRSKVTGHSTTIPTSTSSLRERLGIFLKDRGQTRHATCILYAFLLLLAGTWSKTSEGVVTVANHSLGRNITVSSKALEGSGTRKTCIFHPTPFVVGRAEVGDARRV